MAELSAHWGYPEVRSAGAAVFPVEQSVLPAEYLAVNSGSASQYPADASLPAVLALAFELVFAQRQRRRQGQSPQSNTSLASIQWAY